MSSILHNPSNTKIISGDRQRNPEIVIRYFFQQAVNSAQKDIKDAYNECLSSFCFHGGWHEKPKYKPRDYEGYASLMRNRGQPIRKNLTKYALIGANKLWETLDTLTRKVQNNLEHLSKKHESGEDSIYPFFNLPIETAELNCPDGLCARTTPIDTDSSYDYKNLLVLDPKSNLNVKIRAVSAYSFWFDNFIGGNKNNVARRLLESYKRFHSMITKDEAKLAVTYSIR